MINRVLLNFISVRQISTSSVVHGKRNFRKFLLYNKRGPRIFKEQRARDPDNAPIPIDTRGVRETGFRTNGRFVVVPEMIPELIVPDLEGCKLKPYVSYKCPDVVQSEFTSQDLFNAIYSEKIVEDFKQGQLKSDGTSEQPSDAELLTKEEAFQNARKTGSDIFKE